MSEPSVVELESKDLRPTADAGVAVSEDGERPQKLAKIEEASSADSTATHQLRDPEAAAKVEKELEKEVAATKAEKDGTRKGRTVFSFGYLGEGYQGLQVNKNAKTIEPVLFDAMIKAGVVYGEKPSFDSVSWDRAARTDKGVSAAANVISLNCITDPYTIERLNSHLPENIRFWHFQRTSKTFRAHVRADSRRYTYILPTFFFKPLSVPADQAWTFDEEVRRKVQLVLDRFLGHHKFHHYTQSMEYKNPEASRHIISFVCGEPFVVEGIEWVRLTVVGGSFVLNQIRKMVATTVQVIIAEKDPKVVDTTFEGIPAPALQIAPGEGLFLEEPLYTGHNLHLDPPNLPITIDTVRDTVNNFASAQILPSIVRQEVENKVFTNWLDTASKWMPNWEKIEQDFVALKEQLFEDAKRQGHNSAKTCNSAEEYYQSMLAYKASKKVK